MILDDIAASAKKRVDRDKRERGQAVREAAEQLGKLEGSPFMAQIQQPELSFICEIKKASPSKGVIRESFPYLDLAKEYEAAGANAVSVLTEPEYFQGSSVYLQEIAQTIALPVLRKDFIVDVFQIYEARTLGAAAVLLIAAITDDRQLKEYLACCRSLGLDALCEAHNEEEVRRLAAAGADIIGINNRNLKDFTVHMETSLQLRSLIPAEAACISESGIQTKDDIQALRSAGYDGVLIGETLMRSASISRTLQELRQ